MGKAMRAVPKPGETVYISGGPAQVVEVCESSHERGTAHFVRVRSQPERWFNWEQYLAGKQSEFQRRYEREQRGSWRDRLVKMPVFGGIDGKARQ
ncbi:MAG: hypothetical protein IT406_02970 [Candidatus Yanofskybacteria bacterium]|nr:hypothetical protein [Candidatus Yanofskybacteria bacterium]